MKSALIALLSLWMLGLSANAAANAPHLGANSGACSSTHCEVSGFQGRAPDPSGDRPAPSTGAQLLDFAGRPQRRDWDKSLAQALEKAAEPAALTIAPHFRITRPASACAVLIGRTTVTTSARPQYLVTQRLRI